jgi:hypothetical protein
MWVDPPFLEEILGVLFVVKLLATFLLLLGVSPLQLLGLKEMEGDAFP